MVHNGIEYGDMQLIAEAYHILHQALGLEATELAAIFDEWNRGELDSYLIAITAQILRKIDDLTGKPLVDVVLDTAQQKGTGKWTSQDSFNIAAPVPTINTAVVERIVSSMKGERVAAAASLPGPGTAYDGNRPLLIESVRQALYASKISAYAQGMAMLRIASHEYGYDLNLGEIASIWRAGCIIRARFLNRITAAFAGNAGSAQSARRRRLHASRIRTPAGVAFCRAHCRGSGYPGAGLQCQPGLLRQLPQRPFAGQPDPGPTRLFWRPHLSARGHGRIVPFGLDVV